MKTEKYYLFNVKIEEWSEAHGRYIEFERQYAGQNDDEAIKEAEQKNPGAAILSATQLHELDRV